MAWFQLLYSSAAAAPGRAGGWGVIESSPNLPVELRDCLVEGVVTRIDEVKPTDEFAQRGELAARARCFSFRPIDTGLLWWNAVVAGKDATGRPGNTFTHGVATDVSGNHLRSTDLWNPHLWLVPFGATEVSEVRLSEFVDPEPVGWVAPLERALENLEATEALVSAVTTCFEDDRPLVLVSETSEEFLDWLRVVVNLTARAVANCLPFSTFVRGSELRSLRGGFEIVRVPRVDLDEVLKAAAGNPRRFLHLDLADLPTRRFGDEWWYAGQHWNAGERWQNALFALSRLDSSAVSEVLSAMDDLFADATLHDHLSPAWPLALAMVRAQGDGYPDAGEIAEEWLRLRPFDALRDETVLGLLDRHTPRSNASARRMASVQPRRLVDVYLELERVDTTDAAVAAARNLVEGNLDYQPDEWRSVCAELAGTQVHIEKLQGIDGAVKTALLSWIRVAPILMDLDRASDAEAPGMRRAALVMLGMTPGSDEFDGPRVQELLAARQHMSPRLVQVLDTVFLRGRGPGSTTTDPGGNVGAI